MQDRSFLTWTAPGVCRLDIAVATNARRTEAAGWHDGALRVRLAARPVDGAANEALRQWLAAELGIAPSRVKLLRGQTSRRKQFVVEAESDAVARWIDGLPAA